MLSCDLCVESIAIETVYSLCVCVRKSEHRHQMWTYQVVVVQRVLGLSVVLKQRHLGRALVRSLLAVVAFSGPSSGDTICYSTQKIAGWVGRTTTVVFDGVSESWAFPAPPANIKVFRSPRAAT